MIDKRKKYDILYQEGKDEQPYSGDDRRKKSRHKLSDEAKVIVNETVEAVVGRISKTHHCIIPPELRQHLKHTTLAIEEVGKGDIARGINTAKDVIKRSYSFFETQDKSKITAIMTMIKWIIPIIFSLIVAGLYIKSKGG